MTDHTPAAQAAMQESERVTAADEYFSARTWIMDTNDNRRIFEAGFDRAYALLSKLRAPVADERAAFEAAVHEEYGTSAASMLIRDADGDYATMNTEWVFWLKRAALASAPVAEPETMEEIHRRERERAPWVLPKDPTLPESAPVAGERAALRQAVTLLLQVHPLLGPCDHELRDRIGAFLGKGGDA